MNGDFSRKRRQILRGFGLGLAAYVSPAVLGLNMARASGRSSISDISAPSRPSRPSAPSRPNVAPAPPEIVLLSEAEIDAALTQAGYGVLQKKACNMRSFTGSLCRRVRGWMGQAARWRQSFPRHGLTRTRFTAPRNSFAPTALALRMKQ